jgi:hypothetical protein
MAAHGPALHSVTAATTTSDHSNHIFDPSSIPFHSSLPPSSMPHSIGNCNLVFNPGGILFISANSSHTINTNHGYDCITSPSGNKATKADGEAATPPHSSQLMTLPTIPS